MTDYAENKILTDSYVLFDRILYGGVGYGTIIIPLNFFKIIFTLIFPPFGEILSIIGDALLNNFPYITWDTLKLLFNIDNLNRIIYSLILTSMFYIPGLIYTLSKITTNTPNVSGTLKCDPYTGDCKELFSD
jgi:uncharacterized membrane protein YqaE (UPF0057 family)